MYLFSFPENLKNFNRDRRNFTHLLRLRNKNLYLNIKEWRPSPSGTAFSKPIGRVECLFEVFLHVCQEERWHVLQKFIHKIHNSRN